MLFHKSFAGEGPCVPHPIEAWGGWTLEALLVAYIFWGFYLVTDVFFLPAISILIEKLHIPDDLAGATILGAALNAPELFSNLIGVFVLKNPVGLGLVMGSFNFNLLCISGFTAIFSRQHLRSRQLKLEWRYLQRDAGIYMLAVLLLITVAGDGQLQAWECFSLLGLYVAYVLACVLTGQIARLCCGTDRKPRRKRPLGKVITEAMGEDWLEAHLSPAPSLSAPLASAWSNSDPSAPSAPIRSPPSVHVASSPPPRASAPDGTFPLHEMAAGAALEADANGTARACEQEDSSRRELLKVLRDLLADGYNNLHSNTSRKSFDAGYLQGAREDFRHSVSAPADTPALQTSSVPNYGLRVPLLTQAADEEAEQERQRNWSLVENMLLEGSAADITHLLKADARLIAVAIDTFSHKNFATDVMQLTAQVERDEEADAHQHENLLTWPKSGSLLARATFVATWPLTALLSLTMSHKPSFFVPTIIAAISWLAVLAFALDWASSRVGCSLGIDDELIGMTVVAAGTSLPNVFAAVVAGSKGQVETSISQAFGSNIFDILIAFGLPYSIQCALSGWKPVPVKAGNISRDGLVDLGVLGVYLAVLFASRMRLTRVNGALCILMYIGYLIYEVVDFLVL